MIFVVDHRSNSPNGYDSCGVVQLTDHDVWNYEPLYLFPVLSTDEFGFGR